MKLTLAMGLQYDNGNESSMFALSLGSDKPLQSGEAALKPAIVAAVQIKPVEALAVPPITRSKASFFLTYNLRGLNDTLIFEQGLVDLFV